MYLPNSGEELLFAGAMVFVVIVAASFVAANRLLGEDQPLPLRLVAGELVAKVRIAYPEQPGWRLVSPTVTNPATLCIIRIAGHNEAWTRALIAPLGSSSGSWCWVTSDGRLTTAADWVDMDTVVGSTPVGITPTPLSAAL